MAGAGHIFESVEFAPAGDQRLVYGLEVNTKCPVVAADYQEGSITVRVPQGQAREWIETNRIGIEGEQTLGNDRILRILIEKDFQCLHAGNGQVESEVDHEAYPNPLANADRQEAPSE